MRKLVYLGSAALLAIGFASSANALECVYYDSIAVRCAWDFHGDYDVKGSDLYYGSCPGGVSEPSKGSSCLDALNDLQSNQDFYPYTSTGNGLSDTHILRRCNENVC